MTLIHTRKICFDKGMSLLELLIAVAIISVIATLVIPNISPMRGATSTQIARQQQAELQTALGAWIASTSSGPGGLAAAQAAYNGAGNALSRTNAAGFKIADYLQPATTANLTNNGNVVTSAALSAAGAQLEFSGWAAVTDSPIVEWK